MTLRLGIATTVPKLLDNSRIESANRIGFAEADLRVLFIGNSHTSTHNVPVLFRSLCESDEHDIAVYVESRTQSPFLADHARNPSTLEAINTEGWNVVVLQAQKYSMSGKYSYPTTGAIRLTRLAQAKGARVIMFPEWGRKGHPEEAARVEALHMMIARECGAEVAPIGRAWNTALTRHPDLPLHAADGNHSNAHGAYLTACVLYAHLRNASPVGLPPFGRGVASGKTLLALQTVAQEAVESRR